MAEIEKRSFMLVNRAGAKALDIIFGESSDPLNPVYADWDLDGNGAIRTIVKQEAQTQITLKNVFTEKQPNGLGTHIYDIVGMKDVSVRRLSIFTDISLSMLTLKSFGDSEISRQSLNPDDLIATITELKVTEDENNPSVSRISMRIKAESGVEIPVSVI